MNWPSPTRPDPTWPGLTRPDPTRPWRSLPVYFSDVLKDTGLKIVVSNFHSYIFIGSEVIAFFAKTDFCHFLYIFAYNSRTTEHFENLIISRESTLKDQSESLWFLFWKKSFITYKTYFLGQIDRFSPYYFGKSGQGGLIMDCLCSLSSIMNSLVRNKHFLSYGS